MARRVRVGAEQAEQMGTERSPGRPRLLAVQAPATGLVVTDSLGREASEVGAGVGLAPALAPQILARRHAGEVVVLLRLGAELVDRRGQQEDAVLRDPLRSSGPVVLLLEDQPLPE